MEKSRDEIYEQYTLNFYTTSERNKAIETLREAMIKPIVASFASIRVNPEGADLLKKAGVAFTYDL